MGLQLASEGELEHSPNVRQGGSDNERVNAISQQGGKLSYGGNGGGAPSEKEKRSNQTNLSSRAHYKKAIEYPMGQRRTARTSEKRWT